MLKNWVDQYGLSSPPARWQPVTGAVAYDAAVWRTARRAGDFDEDSIGLLAVPAHSLNDLGEQLRALYSFLGEPDELEQAIIDGGAGSRRMVLEAISNLDGARYAGRQLF